MIALQLAKALADRSDLKGAPAQDVHAQAQIVRNAHLVEKTFNPRALAAQFSSQAVRQPVFRIELAAELAPGARDDPKPRLNIET